MTYRYVEPQRESATLFCVSVDFDDEDWLEKGRNGGSPHDLHKALADGGWLEIAPLEEVGSVGLASSKRHS